MVDRFYEDGNHHVNMAILIHNYVFAVLIVLLLLAIMCFLHTVEVDRSIPRNV
jgi:hypothetical protein